MKERRFFTDLGVNLNPNQDPKQKACAKSMALESDRNGVQYFLWLSVTGKAFDF